MAIKLVAIDLDDTLLDHSRQVSPRAREAVRRAIAAGVTVTVATGRMYRSALPYALQLNLDVPLITYNGALIKRSQSGETLYHRPLDEQMAVEVLKLCRQKGWYIQSYIDDTLYVRERDEYARYYEEVSGVTAVPIGDKLYTPQSAPTKLLAMAKPEELAIINTTLQDRFGDKLYLAVSKPTYLEITHPVVNKGAALVFLGERLGIAQDEIMAIGDSINDLDMIQYAGLGVAMGNAAAAVKQAANAVTEANDADGVAAAIEKYVLQKAAD